MKLVCDISDEVDYSADEVAAVEKEFLKQAQQAAMKSEDTKTKVIYKERNSINSYLTMLEE